MNKISKKSLFLKVRISQNEKEIIEAKAKENGLSTSDYIRQTTLNYRLRNSKLQKESLCSIARIASNMNQVARHANIYQSNANALHILVSLCEIEKSIKELRKCI